MLNLKQGDKIICTKAYHPFINGGIYELGEADYEYRRVVHDGWTYWAKANNNNIVICVGSDQNIFDVYVPPEDLNLVYKGSELIELMLSDGCNYIMCELSNAKGGFTLGEGLHDIGVVNWAENSHGIANRWLFETVDGNFYDEARAINLDGSVMTYQDYLKTKNTEV